MNTTETTGESVTVRVLKYDGAEYRRWDARLKRREDTLLVLDANFEVDVQHYLLGDIQRGTRTREFYWLDRWYNIFQLLEDNETTRLYYCNINMPPMFEAGQLTYIDLDIDILVQPDLSYQVLDLEEFEANAARYDYSDDVQKKARAAVSELISMIEMREFPFIESALRSSASSVA